MISSPLPLPTLCPSSWTCSSQTGPLAFLDPTLVLLHWLTNWLETVFSLYLCPSLLHIFRILLTFLMTLFMNNLFKMVTNFQPQHYKYLIPCSRLLYVFFYRTSCLQWTYYTHCLLPTLFHYALYEQRSCFCLFLFFIKISEVPKKYLA